MRRWRAPINAGGGVKPLSFAAEWVGTPPDNLSLAIWRGQLIALEQTPVFGGSGVARVTVTDAEGQVKTAEVSVALPGPVVDLIDALVFVQTSASQSNPSTGIIPLNSALHLMSGVPQPTIRDQHNPYATGPQVSFIPKAGDGWITAAANLAYLAKDAGESWGVYSHTTQVHGIATSDDGQYGALVYSQDGVRRSTNGWTSSTSAIVFGTGNNSGRAYWDEVTQRFLFSRDRGFRVIHPTAAWGSHVANVSLLAGSSNRAIAGDRQGTLMIASGNSSSPWYLGTNIFSEADLIAAGNWASLGATTSAFGDVIDLKFGNGVYAGLMLQTALGHHLVVYTSDNGASWQTFNLPVAAVDGIPAIDYSHSHNKWMFAVPTARHPETGNARITLLLTADFSVWETYELDTDIEGAGTCYVGVGTRRSQWLT